jgi:MFS family permease
MPVGRRPVLAAAIALEAVALVLFISAGGVPVLLLARVAQGVATGAAITTLAATLVDLNPAARTGPRRGRQWRRAHHRPRSGALGCGALVQFAPAPTHLIYALLLGGMGLAAVVVGGMPETSARRPGLLASPTPRLSVPARLRRDVYALVPIFKWPAGRSPGSTSPAAPRSP